MNIEIDSLNGKVTITGITLELTGFVSGQDFLAFQSANQLVLSRLAARLAALEAGQPPPTPTPTPTPTPEPSTSFVAVVGTQYTLLNSAKVTYRGQGNIISTINGDGSIAYEGSASEAEIKIKPSLGIAGYENSSSIRLHIINEAGKWVFDTRRLTLAEYQTF